MTDFKNIGKKILAQTLIACAVLPLFAVSPVTQSVNAAADNDHPIVVSMGDSFSAGEGIEDFYDQDLPLEERVHSKDWVSHSSENSWPGQLKIDGVDKTLADNRVEPDGTVHGDGNWYFVATSGATTYHLNNSFAKDYHKESFGKVYDGCTYVDPQIDTLKKLKNDGKTVDYVTISIGGNDVGFVDVVSDAAINPNYTNASGLASMLRETWSRFYTPGGIRDNILQAYRDIHNAAPDAKIIVAGYPRLLDEEGKGALFNKYEANLINESVTAFNKELQCLVNIAKAEGIKICFVSVEKGFKDHGAFSDTPFLKELELWHFQDLNDPDFDNINKNNIKEQAMRMISAYSMHPNKDGAEIYRNCVQDKIDQIEKDGGKSEWPTIGSSEERDIVLVLDVSGSMYGTPMDETKNAANRFIDTVLNNDASIGIVTYDSAAYKASDFMMNKNYLSKVVSSINSGGGTNIEAGLRTANEMLSQSNAKKKIIVLMSDGLPNEGSTGESLISYANSIKDEDIYIYTLGFFQALSYEKSEAQNLMNNIASEGCYYDVRDANDLVFFFGDIADQISGTRYIYVRIACPVDVTVSHGGETLCSESEKENTRTEFGTLTFEENDEEAKEGADNRIKILRLKEGTDYDIRIEGNGRGKMNYTIGFMDENGEYSDMRKFRNIKITKKTEIDTVATPSPETVLNVDEDGDGKYDIVYKAEANGRGRIVDYTYLYYIGAGVGAAVILAIVITVAVKKRSKKIKNN